MKNSITIGMDLGDKNHSAWVSRALEALGCTVLVGNPRKLRMIWAARNKNDVADAEMLGRIARFDRALLYPIHHRGPESQQDLALLKARDMLVWGSQCRT